METLKIQIPIKENLVPACKKTSVQLKAQLQQYLSLWLKQLLTKQTESKKKDP